MSWADQLLPLFRPPHAARGRVVKLARISDPTGFDVIGPDEVAGPEDLARKAGKARRKAAARMSIPCR